MRWWNISGPNVITISSLAKGFGVPVAVISGSARWIKKFAAESATRYNNSPVSNAHLGAVKRVLELNAEQGNARRSKLLSNVKLLRNSLDFPLQGGSFPVQTINFSDRKQVVNLHQQLSYQGFQSVLVGPHGKSNIALMIMLRADHLPREIRGLSTALQYLLRSKSYYSIQKYEI